MSRRKKMDINEKLVATDLLFLEQNLQNAVENKRLYWVRNDAKLRAVHTSQTYEEFRDIVDAAHLCPLAKGDQINGANATTVWNKYASKDKTDLD